ncbi:hypothetical protein HK097_006490 [Rhizophlyctis rosea]|uniref:Uncharacterized protein n=1 Tax=Rhizophlyctis rosea TaxID=64517 RepID=A0AAD5SDA1_9FUNG|nr:hypothetical protein HK097_006490 [Rhizophlyctis rosea]
MSGTTTCLRFPGHLNANLRKPAVKMFPIPWIHVSMVHSALLDSSQYPILIFTNRNQHKFAMKNMTARPLQPLPNRRCDVPSSHVPECLHVAQKKHSSFFVHWIPERSEDASVSSRARA